jgi:CRISPR-associated exonuclease Cas4
MEKWDSGDDDVVLISEFEHYVYCQRQWALIHREQVFDENLYTLRGQAAHERVDEEAEVCQEGVLVERALPLWSRDLGLRGRADVVEFYGATPYPVEYKSGRHAAGEPGEVQLCAQGLALEEMMGQPVPRGCLYVVANRQRREIEFTPALREKVIGTLEEIRRLMREESLPPPVADLRCSKCSLVESCLPEVIADSSRRAALEAGLFVAEVPA